MAKYTGEKATVKIGENDVLKLNAWKLTIKATLVDTTSFEDEGWESNETSTKSWEVTLEGLFNPEDTTGQVEIMKQLALGGALETEFYKYKNRNYRCRYFCKRRNKNIYKSKRYWQIRRCRKTYNRIKIEGNEDNEK